MKLLSGTILADLVDLVGCIAFLDLQNQTAFRWVRNQQL